MDIYHWKAKIFSSTMLHIFFLVALVLQNSSFSGGGEICAGEHIIVNCTNRNITIRENSTFPVSFQCDVCCQLGNCCFRNGSIHLRVIHLGENVSLANDMGQAPKFCKYILTHAPQGGYFNPSEESITMAVAGFNGSNNRFSLFPCFVQWPKLEWIDLSKNDIYRITSPLFFGNGSILTTLILRDVGLYVTYEHIFKHLKRLRYANMSGNPIEDYHFLSHLNDNFILDLRRKNFTSNRCKQICAFCSSSIKLVINTVCEGESLCVESNCSFKYFLPSVYTYLPPLSVCEAENSSQDNPRRLCGSFEEFGISFLSSGSSCIWVPVLFLITSVVIMASLITLIRWKIHTRRRVFLLTDTIKANTESRLIEWSPEGTATPVVRRMSIDSQKACFSEDHSTFFRDSLLISNQQNGRDRGVVSIVLASRSFESTFQPGLTLTTCFTWNEGLQHRRMLPLPMTPDELRISEYYSEGHSTSDETYLSVGSYTSKGKIYLEDAIYLVVELSSGLVHNRWFGVIAVQNQPNKCAIFTTLTDAIQKEDVIHWELFIKRVLELRVSENLLRIEGTCIYKEKYYLIHEHLISKTLYSRITSNEECSSDNSLEDSFGPVVTSDAIRYMEGILNAMDLLHSYGFHHPGLSTKKILLTKQGICKLYDFCLPEDASSIVAAKKSQMTPSINNFAPEALFTDKYTKASDVWSTAVVIWEILSDGSPPFSARNDIQNEYDVTITLPNSWPQKYRHLRNDTLFECWNQHCSHRPTIHQLLSSFSEVFLSEDEINISETESLSSQYLVME